jgi:hypothetical protein
MTIVWIAIAIIVALVGFVAFISLVSRFVSGVPLGKTPGVVYTRLDGTEEWIPCGTWKHAQYLASLRPNTRAELR